MTILQFLLILGNTVLLVSGQFLWKFGLEKQVYSFNSVTNIIKLIFSPYIIGGLTIYGIATVLWLFILTKVHLSVAYPIQSTAYILAVFGAVYFFGEPLTVWKIVGVLMIMVGVSLIGLSPVKG